MGAAGDGRKGGLWGHFRAGAEAGSSAGPAWEAVWPAWAGRKPTVLEPLSCGTLVVWLRTPLLRPLGRCAELQRPALLSLEHGPRVQTASSLLHSCSGRWAYRADERVSPEGARGSGARHGARNPEPLRESPRGRGPEVPGMALEEGSAVEHV